MRKQSVPGSLFSPPPREPWYEASTQRARSHMGILCAYGTQNFFVAADPPVETACAEGFAL